MTIHRYVDLDRRSNQGQYPKGIKQQTRALNEYFNPHRSKVYQTLRDFLEENKPTIAITLRNRIQGSIEEQ